MILSLPVRDYGLSHLSGSHVAKHCIWHTDESVIITHEMQEAVIRGRECACSLYAVGSIYHRVSQEWHNCPLGPDNSFWWLSYVLWDAQQHP